MHIKIAICIWGWNIHKYTTKYKDLSDEEQKALAKKTKTCEVEVIIDGNKTTLVQPQQIVSYNNSMRSKTFEQQMLEFVKRTDARLDKIEKRLDEHDEIFKRNNLK